MGEAYRVTTGLTGLPASFYYVRPSERRYRVTVPASFHAHESTLPPAAVAAMAARTQLCLTAVQPALSGPNGEEIEIQLVPAGFEGMRPLEVEVTAQEVRGHARLWQVNWQCPEIVHEVGHFLGLVDKYPEPPQLKVFDCRHRGLRSSVMYDPWEAYAKVSPKLEMAQCGCEGLSGDALVACTDALSRVDRETVSCPAGTLARRKPGRILEYANPEAAAKALALAGKTATDDGLWKWIVMRHRAERANLFTPAEFRVIAHPNWLQGNAKYYACAVDAYRTSKAFGGEGCLAAPGCEDGSWARD